MACYRCYFCCCYFLGGPISTAAYNPASAISLYAAGKLPESDLIPYIIVEILGALGAFYAYKNFVIKR
jgi:glycerol uptake facilitator-like aquaporin